MVQYFEYGWLGAHGVFYDSAEDASRSLASRTFKALSSNPVELCLSGILIPERQVQYGQLIKCSSAAWSAIIDAVVDDWDLAYAIPPEKWEEIIAGAFAKAGYETVLTPRSGDRGRDVIATSRGIGCIKIIGSVKAYKRGGLVRYDEVRSLLGVLSGERDASKGLIATTSDFGPKILEDPFIGPFVPTRLELMNGVRLRQWLAALADR